MSLVNIPSYEGSLPFIYVYYAEEDTRLALPVLTRLYNEGLRMWSWNGCAHPTDVRAAQRISSCAALLVFLSENLDRDISREYFEAMEALRCNKVKYFVRLSDVELPFDWGKSDANVVIDYVRSNEAAFWLSIYDSDIIEGCRGAWPSEPIKTGMSAFDAIDSSELSDEYSSILNIMGNIPVLDRSGVPVNAEDIALFNGAGESEKSEAPVNAPAQEMHTDDLNSKSMQELFGMLDEISVSTRQKAEELQQSAEKRRAEQQRAALSKASLPFEQDAVKTAHSDEPPVPALSFLPSAMTVEELASEMFGVDFSEVPLNTEVLEESEPESPTEVIIIENVPETAEPETEPEPSFEEFIDDLAGINEPQEIEEDTEEKSEESPEPAEDHAFVPMPTSPKTVEITEQSEFSLLPPASGSLTGFTLPDDNYMNTVYVYNDDEDSPSLSAADRAAAAEESRKQFESALENAAYRVTGRIVARHSKGLHSVGLRVRKPKTVKLSVQARVKPAAKADATASVNKTSKSEKATNTLSRAERRAERRRKKDRDVSESEALPERKALTVVPAPMRVDMPAPKPVELPEETAPAEAPAAEEISETPISRRKKRHPHNSSGLLNILRELKSQKNEEESSEDI